MSTLLSNKSILFVVSACNGSLCVDEAFMRIPDDLHNRRTQLIWLASRLESALRDVEFEIEQCEPESDNS